ncbi:hypothetical protein [Pseudomonas helleri]|uniref:hypothetical protein n=1 Tax=Pseudomonas helleri TaxID=1608996 RepID=UPI0024303B89|nr:hypothetical protein [Pseudomonas helleri]
MKVDNQAEMEVLEKLEKESQLALERGLHNLQVAYDKELKKREKKERQGRASHGS